MGGIFSSPKVPAAPAPAPAPEPPPPPPERTDAEIAALAEKQRRRFFAKQGGRASTMLTGASGVSEANQSAAVAYLGGVGRA